MQNITKTCHIEVIGGRNKGQVGYVSDVNTSNVQVTTGDDTLFNVRKTSLRVVALAVAPTVNTPIVAHAEAQVVNNGNTRVDYHRIIHLIDRVGHILRHEEILLTQWQEINIMVRELFGVTL